MVLSRNSSVCLLCLEIIVVTLLTTLAAEKSQVVSRISKIVERKSKTKTCQVYNLKTQKLANLLCTKIPYPYYLKTDKTCRSVISKKVMKTVAQKFCKMPQAKGPNKPLSIIQQKDRVVEITSSKTKTCKIMSKKGLFADFATKCSTLTGFYYQRWQGSCQLVDTGKKVKKTVASKMCDTKNAKATFVFQNKKCIAMWTKPKTSLVFESLDECSISMINSKFELAKHSKFLMIMQPSDEKFKCNLIRKSGKPVLELTNCKKTLRRYFLRTSKGCIFGNFNTNTETETRHCDARNQAYYIYQNPTTKLCEFSWLKVSRKTKKFPNMGACRKKFDKPETTEKATKPPETTSSTAGVITTATRKTEGKQPNAAPPMVKPAETVKPTNPFLPTPPLVILTTTRLVVTTTTPKPTTTTTTTTTTPKPTTKKLDPEELKRKADANFAQCCRNNVAKFNEACLKKNICRYDVTEDEFQNAYATMLFGRVVAAGVCPGNSVKTYRSCASNQRDFRDCCASIAFQSEAERTHCPRSCAPFSSTFPTDTSSLLAARVCNKYQARIFRCFRQKLYQV